MNRKGFSLLEIIIGIAILGLIGGLLGGILTRVYKGNNKTTLVGSIKQNGQTSLSTLDSAIRNAETVVCPSTTLTSTNLVIQNKDGSYTRFTFIPPSLNANGYIEQDILTLANPSDAPNLCNTTNFPPLAPFPITDRNPSTGISVISGSFKVQKSSGLKEIVSIQFEISPPILGGSGFENTIGGDKIGFQTTVQLR